MSTTGARKREPVYTVLAVRELEQPAQQWNLVLEPGEELKPGQALEGWTPGEKVRALVEIADAVRAPSARAAVAQAIDLAYPEPGDSRRVGTFAVVLDGQLRTLTRSTATETVEVWS